MKVLIASYILAVFLDRNLASSEDINNVKTSKQDNYNPCSLPKDSQPDFAAPWRRLSLIKCYEFIWEIKHRDDLEKRFKECDEFVKKNPDRLVPHHALYDQDAPPSEYPHLASIGWKAKDNSYKYKCVGALVSQKFVLTAAHCTSIKDDPDLVDHQPKVLRLGDFNSKNTVKQTTISKIIVHPSYRSTETAFDVALLQVFFFISLTKYIHPACLLSTPDLSSIRSNTILTGLKKSGEMDTAKLTAVESSILKTDKCDKMLKEACGNNSTGLTDHQFCAEQPDKREDWTSEGLLQVKLDLPIKQHGEMSLIIGLPSLGPNCSKKSSPNVFTKVSSYIDWIEENVWPST